MISAGSFCLRNLSIHMPEATNSDASLPADKGTKQPKPRKAAGKSRRKAEEAKVQEEAVEPKPVAQSDPGANPTDQAASSANEKQQEGKRPNRRRRGKGKSQGKDPEREGAEDTPAAEEDEPKGKSAQQGTTSNSQRPPQPPRRKVDPEKLAKNAWKIYLAEVSEEGVALIGDNDARELARRCFRLSEIFLEEEGRRS